MRTLGSLTGHIAGDAHRLCAMLRINLVDGTTLAFTDHNEELSFDLGDGVTTYSPGTGILPSDLSLSAGFDADDMEISGPIGDVVSASDIVGGRFDDATVRYFLVNWSDLSQGAAKLVKGWVVQATVEGSKFKLLLHSEISRFAQSVGKVITGYCDADFGDTRCTKVPVTVAATVTAATDGIGFTVSFTGSYANDFFNKGTVTFLTGALAGVRPIEIYDWTSGGAVTLLFPAPDTPHIGDTLTLTQGCGKTRTDCMGFANIDNFRGFPDVPGTDQLLRYPNPSS